MGWSGRAFSGCVPRVKAAVVYTNGHPPVARVRHRPRLGISAVDGIPEGVEAERPERGYFFVHVFTMASALK